MCQTKFIPEPVPVLFLHKYELTSIRYELLPGAKHLPLIHDKTEIAGNAIFRFFNFFLTLPGAENLPLTSRANKMGANKMVP